MAVKYTFKSEGGYVNNKNDMGGPTNFGITQDAYDSWNKKHNIQKKDVKNITKKEASDILYYDYWILSGAEEIDDFGMAYAIFDTEMNAGNGTNNELRKAGFKDLDSYLEAKKNHHAKTIKIKPEQIVFKKGWENRLKDVKKNAAELRMLQSFPKKYSGDNAIENMTNEEFKQNEADINKEIQTRYEVLNNYKKEKLKIKDYNPKIPIITGGASSVDNVKQNDFEVVSINGKNWKDFSDKEKMDFTEGFDTGAFTDEGIKKVKLQEKMWTDKFNICDPNKDDGHWITLPNGKHLFIKN